MSTNVAREGLALVCIIDTQLEPEAWKDIFNEFGVKTISNIDVLISRALKAFSDNGFNLLNLLAGAHNDLAGGGIVIRNLEAPDGFDDFVYSFDISIHGYGCEFAKAVADDGVDAQTGVFPNPSTTVLHGKSRGL
ncbi:uncharacterized protein PgNI_02604 [Pyricularia grisea]|uniref:Uncharacterized protein n=1 Tax=Pyricularia grisea TaxID=148305 RepID=A0A6P8BI63_PYRGI|nr:uncharacterized protein PgNI_02604 [Pyricularia grisea]TLD16312.1 hypothetical protein PgNI_02604 [Pyricularia grisea]